MSNENTNPRLYPSAKDRFRSSPENISRHTALVDSKEFQRALDFAFLSYQEYLTRNASDGPTAMASMVKLSGAREFVEQFLRTLADAPPIMPQALKILDHLPEMGNPKRQ